MSLNIKKPMTLYNAVNMCEFKPCENKSFNKAIKCNKERSPRAFCASLWIIRVVASMQLKLHLKWRMKKPAALFQKILSIK